MEILVDGQVVGRVVADEFRPDLAKAGYGEGRHAFYFELPPATDPATVSCRVEGFFLARPSAAGGDAFVRWRARRRERLLAAYVPGRHKAIEFGALHDPIIHPGEANLRYVDHATTTDLRSKYGDDVNVDVRELVEVDHVWLDGDLRDAVGDFAPVDFAVAAHVAEHVPDLVGWLAQVRSAMRPGATLALAQPDKRYCFDEGRRLSGVADLIQAHLERRKRPSAETIVDALTNSINRGGAITWYTWQTRPATVSKHDERPLREIYEVAERVVASGAYFDAHCWVFTSDSFVETMNALGAAGLFPFRFRDFHGPDGNEFIAILEAV